MREKKRERLQITNNTNTNNRFTKLATSYDATLVRSQKRPLIGLLSHQNNTHPPLLCFMKTKSSPKMSRATKNVPS